MYIRQFVEGSWELPPELCGPEVYGDPSDRYACFSNLEGVTHSDIKQIEKFHFHKWQYDGDCTSYPKEIEAAQVLVQWLQDEGHPCYVTVVDRVITFTVDLTSGKVHNLQTLLLYLYILRYPIENTEQVPLKKVRSEDVITARQSGKTLLHYLGSLGRMSHSIGWHEFKNITIQEVINYSIGSHWNFCKTVSAQKMLSDYLKGA